MVPAEVGVPVVTETLGRPVVGTGVDSEGCCDGASVAMQMPCGRKEIEENVWISNVLNFSKTVQSQFAGNYWRICTLLTTRINLTTRASNIGVSSKAPYLLLE